MTPGNRPNAARTPQVQLDWWFKTADGTLGQIVALRDDHTVEVELEGRYESRVTLPLAELRRVADPAKKRPPIEELPAERPRCAFCDRPLRALTRDTQNPAVWADGHHNPLVPRILRRVFWRWDGYGWDGHRALFCRHQCATNFGAAAYKAGYRVKRKDAQT